MRKLAIIVVEGPHDVAFVTKLLCGLGLHLVDLVKETDPAWKRLTEVKNPRPKKTEEGEPSFREQDFLPTFVQSESHSVILRSAGGDDTSKMLGVIERIWDAVDEKEQSRIEALGLFVDTDKSDAKARFGAVVSALKANNPCGVDLPTSAGIVSSGNKRCGVFVLPDNSSTGTLETLLLECSAARYPHYHAAAERFVESCVAFSQEDAVNTGSSPELNKRDRKELKAPAGQRKARVAALGALLKPGKAIQNSIQENRWLDDPLPASVENVKRFLASLLSIEYQSPTSASPVEAVSTDEDEKAP